MCLSVSVSDIFSPFSLFFSPLLLFSSSSHFHYCPPSHFSPLPHIFPIYFVSSLSFFPFLLLFPLFLHPPLSPFLSSYDPPPPSFGTGSSGVGRQQQLQKEQLLYVCVRVYMPQLVPSTRLLGQGWSQQGTTTLPTPHRPTRRMCADTHKLQTHTCTKPTYRHKNHMHGHTRDNFTRTFIFKYTPIQ